MQFVNQIMHYVEAAIHEVKERESDSIRNTNLGFTVSRSLDDMNIVVTLFGDTIDLEPIDGPPLAS
jgi:hypothetical protein